jgi:hypothetical protein
VEIDVIKTTSTRKFFTPNGTAVEGGCVTSEGHPTERVMLTVKSHGGQAGMAWFLPAGYAAF